MLEDCLRVCCLKAFKGTDFSPGKDYRLKFDLKKPLSSSYCRLMAIFLIEFIRLAIILACLRVGVSAGLFIVVSSLKLCFLCKFFTFHSKLRSSYSGFFLKAGAVFWISVTPGSTPNGLKLSLFLI